MNVTDANGCATTTQTFTIAQPTNSLSATTNTAANISCISANGSFTINTIGGTPLYSYSINGGTSSTITTYTGLGTGTQTIVVTDQNNCTYTTSAIITGVVAPSISASTQTNVLCYGTNSGAASVTVTGGTNPYTYTWTNNSSISNSITSVSGGTYIVTVQDLGNCIVSQTITITESPALITTASVSPSCPQESTGSATVTASGGVPNYNFNWSNGNTSTGSLSVMAELGEGDYNVTITDNNGCVNNVAITIGVMTCQELFIPELFSPNGDGKNDKFVIQKIDMYPNNNIQIFNRWGSLVYSKNKYNNEWDGKANVGDALGSNMLPAGTYYVVLEFGDNQTKPYHGYVQMEY